MTQSGQGEEPSARVPREGIVLPSDGGAPLLPGDQATPVTGRSWDEPWGPDPSAAPAPPPAQPWAAQEPQATAPAPEWGDQGWGDQGWGAPQPQSQPLPQAPSQQTYGGLPPEGAQTLSYGAPAHPGPAPAGPEPSTPGPTAPVPPQPGPLPPQAGLLDRQAGSPPPPPSPQHGQLSPSLQSAPPPPAASGDEGATQYIPPVVDDSAQYLLPAPAPAPADEAATQYLPPVGPGVLPHEVSGTPEPPSDETQRLGRLPRQGADPISGTAPIPGAAPLPPAAAPGTRGNPDAEATQYIAVPVPPQQPSSPVPPQPYGHGGHPGAPGERREPDVFDSLFRSEPGGAGAAETQQLPLFQPPQAGQYQQPAQGPQPPYESGGWAAARRDGGGRTGSRAPLLAAIGIGIAVLGVGAGALLSSGGDDDQQDVNKPVAAASDTAESPSASADPAKEQAVALDKLLADSGASRTTVIKAVADIKKCANLRQAAADLRNAAKQRNDLVTRLSTLSVDRLPNRAALTEALTNAWKASASADNHYAAWADQTAGKKGCRKGQARTTGQTQAGNRASGTASTEKTKAAQLWNSIASTYGLTPRQPTQL